MAIDAGVTRAIEAGRDRWIGLLSSLVQIPSTFEREHAMVDAVAGRLEAIGCRTVRRVTHDARRLAGLAGAQEPLSDVAGRSSLIAVIPGRGGPSLTINAHLDVADAGAPGGWARPPFSGAVEESRVHGRGAWDDKAGVVAALAVAELALGGIVRPAGDLVLHFVLEDETTGNGSLLCLADGPLTAAAVIVDGTRLDRAIREHAGQTRCHLRVEGKAASVAVAHVAVNAAERLAELTLTVKHAVGQLNAARPAAWMVFPSPFQASVQRLSADAPIFTVPDSAVAELHMTFCPPFTLASFRAWLEDVIRRAAAEHGWVPAPEVSWRGFSAEPVLGGNADLEARLQTAARATGGPEIAIGPSTGTSDLRHFVAAAVPCLLHGPGAGFNPHRVDEYYEVGDLGTMVARLCCLAINA